MRASASSAIRNRQVDSTQEMIETVATVERNDEIAHGYRLLTLSFDEQVRAGAGQFAMLRPVDIFEPLLRRALAVYRVHGPRRLSFLYQVLGRGTRSLSFAAQGQKIETLIPLGNRWLDLKPGASLARARETVPEQPSVYLPRRAIVVAGGIGSASVLMLCENLARAQVETQIFFGAASLPVAAGCGLEDFRALKLPLVVTTDDGTLGERGFVTAPLERYLSEGGGKEAMIYACGPWVMMARVAEIAARFEVECLVSLEAPMGCGFGVCVGCVVAVKTEGPLGYGSYKRVCTDGSVFPAKMIRWEINAMTH